MTRRDNGAGAPPMSHVAIGRALVGGPPAQPQPDGGGNAVSPEGTLDDLLATIERRELSPTEIRVLLRLTEGEATAADLTDALAQSAGAITTVAYRLAMRGLIRRRFENGQRSGFVFTITSAGMLALRPLLQRAAQAGPAGADDCP